MRHLQAVDLINSAEHSGDPLRDPAIIFDALERMFGGPSGCDRSDQQQDVLTAYHRFEVVAEDQLPIIVDLGGDDIDFCARNPPITSLPSMQTMVSIEWT